MLACIRRLGLSSALCCRSVAGVAEAAFPSASDGATLASEGQAIVTTAPNSPAVVTNPLYDDLDIAALDIAVLGNSYSSDADQQVRKA